MKLKLNIMAAVLAAGVAWNLAGAAEPDRAKLKNDLEALFKRAKSQPGDKNARIELNKSILESGEKMQQKFSEILPPSDLYQYVLVRRSLMPAAERLYNDAPTAENCQKLTAIAKAVIALPVHDPAMWATTRGFSPAPEVAEAGKLLAMLNIYETPGAAPKDAAKHIRDMIAMFPAKPEVNGAVDLHKQAMVYALQLAAKTCEKELTQELAAAVAKQCLDTKYALDTLRETGCPAPFEDEVTLMDGRKFSFPKDVKGKITVIEFWATWCGPCRGSLPHIKAIHEKYKDRGVMVIGLCCDAPGKDETYDTCRERVAEFLAKNKCDWTQVYNGKWPKVAIKYGVNGLPRVFVLDRQGNIVSAMARGQEERLIEQELAKDAAKK